MDYDGMDGLGWKGGSSQGGWNWGRNGVVDGSGWNGGLIYCG